MKKPCRLRAGDQIGIVAACYAAEEERSTRAVRVLEAAGFQVKLGENLFRNTWGFAASAEERAADFNAMIRDPGVRMILFGGGEVGNELLPLIDYDALAADPKLLLSYSDGTTILEAVSSRCGICTYYGQSPRSFIQPGDFNRRHFDAAVCSGAPYTFPKGSEWVSLCPGSCEGVLTGGYLMNFAAMLGGAWYRMPDEPCILFLEDMIHLNKPAAVSKWLSHIEQSGLFRQVKGLLWGYYDDEPQPLVDDILRRVGQRWNIPVVRCEDYGHGLRSGILPIGIRARLDAGAGTLTLLEPTVDDA